MLRSLVAHVIGVDTAKDNHAAVVVCSATGGQVAVQTLRADRAGYQGLLEWADEHTAGGNRAWAIEGTGSYGRGLLRVLAAAGEWVIEVDRPQRRRGDAKSDPLDALRAGREVLGRERLAAPRADGDREAARVLVVTRESAVHARTAAINALKALVLTAPEDLRAPLGELNTAELVKRCTRLRRSGRPDAERDMTIETLRGLARRIAHLDKEIAGYDHHIDKLTRARVPGLRAKVGVGPITAAQAFISWSHPGRCRSEAAYANLSGAAPIEASTGKVTRHRLNRGGDRQLNRALHVIVLTRMRCDPATRGYVQRRRAQGKSDREIRRCLKRYTARQLFRALQADARKTP